MSLKPRRGLPPVPDHAGTLISDTQPPALGEINSCCLEAAQSVALCYSSSSRLRRQLRRILKAWGRDRPPPLTGQETSSGRGRGWERAPGVCLLLNKREREVRGTFWETTPWTAENLWNFHSQMSACRSAWLWTCLYSGT